MRTLLLHAPAQLIAALWLLSALFPLPLHQLSGSWPVALMAPFNVALLLTCTVLMLNSLERLQKGTDPLESHARHVTS